MFQGIFGQFNAGYGEAVSLHRSSAAAGGVWLNIEQRNVNPDALDLKGEPANKPGCAAAHLSPAQALVLRAALDSYLAESQEEE